MKLGVTATPWYFVESAGGISILPPNARGDREGRQSVHLSTFLNSGACRGRLIIGFQLAPHDTIRPHGSQDAYRFPYLVLQQL